MDPFLNSVFVDAFDSNLGIKLPLWPEENPYQLILQPKPCVSISNYFNNYCPLEMSINDACNFALWHFPIESKSDKKTFLNILRRTRNLVLPSYFFLNLKNSLVCMLASGDTRSTHLFDILPTILYKQCQTTYYQFASFLLLISNLTKLPVDIFAPYYQMMPFISFLGQLRAEDLLAILAKINGEVPQYFISALKTKIENERDLANFQIECNRRQIQTDMPSLQKKRKRQ